MKNVLKVIAFAFLFLSSTTLFAADQRAETNKELLLIKLEFAAKGIERYTQGLEALGTILTISEENKKIIGLEKYRDYLTDITQKTFMHIRNSDDFKKAYNCVEEHFCDKEIPAYRGFVFKLIREYNERNRHYADTIENLKYAARRCDGSVNAEDCSND